MSEILVREYTTGNDAVYNDIDVNGGRTQVRCSAKYISNDTKWECITLVPDTIHNRTVFLQKKRVEVYEKKGDTWVPIPVSWLESLFKSVNFGGISSPVAKPVESPAEKVEEETTISSIEDVFKLPAEEQIKIVKELGKSSEPEAKVFLSELAKSSNTRFSEKARKIAEDILGARK